MKNATQNRNRAVAFIAFAAIIALFSLQPATGARTTATAADVDLSAEDRVLDGFVTDLGRFDKKSSELGKKATLTRAEFDAHSRDAEGLKSRLTGVQNALREAIRKLKAAGLWENLDQLVQAKINDAAFQNFVRQEGFKRTLEDAAASLSGDAAEISRPLDLLRSRIQAQTLEHGFEPRQSALQTRALRVTYRPEPAVFSASLRCRAAGVRYGIAGLVFGFTTKLAKATANFKCQCTGASGPTGCDFQ